MLKYLINKFGSLFVCVVFVKKVKGIENIPKKGGFIAAANHISYLDIAIMHGVLLTKGRRYIRFVAKKKLLNDKTFSRMDKIFGYEKTKAIILDEKKTQEIFDPVVKALKKNEVIGMYPEGGISLDGNIKKGKTGAVRMALWSKMPIIPMGIRGTDKLMSVVVSKPKFKKKAEINIGKAIYFENYYNKKITKKMLRELTDKVMGEIAKLSGQKYET